MNSKARLEKYMETERTRIDKALDQLLPSKDNPPAPLHYAMRYSTLSGGKRLRPILVVTSYRWAGGKRTDKVIPVACAIELIHTFSLIHDDLPSIDDDDWRRGKPTCHIEMKEVLGDGRLGEATAILAGDALLVLAFSLLAKSGDARIMKEITSSTLDLVRGEMADIIGERKDITLPELEFIHKNKTASLIRASLRVGAIMGGATKSELISITKFGEYVGLAFQIIDDVLGTAGKSGKIGKPVGSDEWHNKATYPKLFGVEKSRAIAKGLVERAKSCLPSHKDNDLLFAIADYVVEREK